MKKQVIVVEKYCQVCGELLTGRKDKKFCDYKCRSAYGNQLRTGASFRYIRNINNTLIVNRNILATFLADGLNKPTSDALKQEGFSFRYHTHTYLSKTGKTYYYCYDYGYLQIDVDNYLIVKRDA